LAGFRPAARRHSIAPDGLGARKKRAIANFFSARDSRALIDVMSCVVRESRNMPSRVAREKLAKNRGNTRVT
jgi:hypothetical protein